MIPGIKPKNQNTNAVVRGLTIKEILPLIEALLLGSEQKGGIPFLLI